MKNYLRRSLLISCFLLISGPLLAHDEGHGPKLTDTGKFGGVLTAVVEAKDASKGASAPLVYKGELTRSEDGTVRVYIYTGDMKILPSTLLGSKAEAKLLSMVGGKETITPFSLTFAGNAYVGTMPKPGSKPYNIDVTFKAADKDLLAAFDHLD
jgi:hypothetical protein